MRSRDNGRARTRDSERGIETARVGEGDGVIPWCLVVSGGLRWRPVVFPGVRGVQWCSAAPRGVRRCPVVFREIDKEMVSDMDSEIDSSIIGSTVSRRSQVVSITY